MAASTVSYQNQFTGAGTLRGSEFFPSPFADVASLSMPENNRSALNMSEYIFNQQGTYRQAMERVMSYFLTDIEMGGDLGDDEKQKWREYLVEEVDIMNFLHKLLRDRMCYGNAFASFVVPFKRFLVCPKCQLQVILREVFYNPIFQFEFKDFNFTAKCPKCNRRDNWDVNDRPQADEQNLKMKLWNVHEMEIVHDPYTEDVQYVWRIPEDYKREIRSGTLFQLERVSMEVLRAIQNNWLFLFHPDQIYHMKEPTVGGIRTRGWGVSRTIVNYRQIYFVQVARRYNEALMQDYVIPFRLITPMPRAGGGGDADIQDPLLMQDQSSFMGMVRRMIRKRRRDPAAWFSLPFPVQYQALGGDASQLAPSELTNQGLETLLNDTGVPVEFYRGTMSLSTAPTSIRLFEAHWHPLVHDSNFFLKWVMRRISQILSWEKGTIKLIRPTYADDIQRQMAMLQLMSGQSISQTSALRGFGLDFKNERKLIGEETRYMQEQDTRIQEELEQAGFATQIAKGIPAGGDPNAMAGGAGGAPAAGGGTATAAQGAGGAAAGTAMGNTGSITDLIPPPGAPVTPQDIEAKAQVIAEQLLGMPESIKDSELRTLAEKHPMLHLAVKNVLEKTRQDARNAGGAMLLQQQHGGQ